jgi:hypothetical protein
MKNHAQMEVELRELAGLLSDAEVAVAAREKIRARLHRLASQARTMESPFLTVSAAARRYGIQRKDFRKLLDTGVIRASVIAGRERVDIRQFDAEAV